MGSSLEKEIKQLKEKTENDQVTIFEQKEEIANLQSQADSLSQLLDENEDLRNENYNLVTELNNEKEANSYFVKNLENNNHQTSEIKEKLADLLKNVETLENKNERNEALEKLEILENKFIKRVTETNENDYENSSLEKEI